MNNKQHTKNNKQHTIFFDRLPRVRRQRGNGKLSSLDGTRPFTLRMSNDFGERKDDVNLVFGDGAKVGITIHDCDDSTKLVEARVDHQIHGVSTDGKTVTVPLVFSASKFKKLPRFFSLTFFDEAGARRFFKTWQCFLPVQKKEELRLVYPTFDGLVGVSKELDEINEKRNMKKNEVEDDEVEEVALSGDECGDQEEVAPRPSKRKRLDPELEDAQDPIKLLDQEFQIQFGESQLY